MALQVLTAGVGIGAIVSAVVVAVKPAVPVSPAAFMFIEHMLTLHTLLACFIGYYADNWKDYLRRGTLL